MTRYIVSASSNKRLDEVSLPGATKVREDYGRTSSRVTAALFETAKISQDVAALTWGEELGEIPGFEKKGRRYVITNSSLDAVLSAIISSIQSFMQVMKSA